MFVVEDRGRLGLLEEASLRGLVAGQVGRQDLDRHLAVQARVVARVDDPHPAAAELGADRVRAEGVEAGSVRRETKLQGERQICRLTVGGRERNSRDSH